MSLKTGLIGAGVFGGYHAGKIAEAQTTDFVGVFDPDAARAAELAEKHGVQAFASQAELFAAADAVLIACPAIYHAETVEAALAANCHVLVEKPLALTGETAKMLAAKADAAPGAARRGGLRARPVCAHQPDPGSDHRGV